MVYYTHKTYKNWNCFRKLILHWIELNELNVKIKFSLEIRIFCKCSWALRHHHAALKLKRIPVLSYFTRHDPTIHNSTMHDSNINYPNQFKLCRKNYKHSATRTIFYLTKERELSGSGKPSKVSKRWRARLSSPKWSSVSAASIMLPPRQTPHSTIAPGIWLLTTYSMDL